MGWLPLSLPFGRFLSSNGENSSRNAEEALASSALTVRLLRRAMPDLQLELSRARRYRRPFSILLLKTEAGEREERKAPPPLLGEPAPQLNSLVAGAMLTDLLRASDEVTYDPSGDRFVVALIETNARHARAALRRIRPAMRRRMGMDFRWGIAAFPDDGLTLGNLIEEAENRWRRTNLAVHGPRGNGTAASGTGGEA